FAPLTLPGGRTVLVRPGGEGDLDHLIELIAGEGVTNLAFPPALLLLLLEDERFRACRALTLVLVGGESVPAHMPERFHAAFAAVGGVGPDLFNRYGPTEASISVTEERCAPGEERTTGDGRPPAIGRPIADARILLLDPALLPVPIGALGEIAIAGPGLARG